MEVYFMVIIMTTMREKVIVVMVAKMEVEVNVIIVIMMVMIVIEDVMTIMTINEETMMKIKFVDEWK